MPTSASLRSASPSSREKRWTAWELGAADMAAMATGVNERLAKLTDAGVSVWLDQIRRGLIESGELRRLVDEDSLRGVPSNPAIFEKAILGSTDYDEQLKSLAEAGKGPKEI